MLNIDAEFNELLIIFRPNTRGIGAIGEFGEFGAALGEISAVEREIHAQWRDVIKSGLGELADIQQDIQDAKNVIAQSIDIGGKIEKLKSRISRLQSKLSKVKNPAAKAKIQEKINAATSPLNVAQGAYNSIQATIGAARDLLAKAGIVVQEAKKAVVETATAAREKAMQFAQKAKETAIAVGQRVKEAAAAAAAKAKVAAEKVRVAAAAAKEFAMKKAGEVRAAAAAAAAKAKALAQQAQAAAAAAAAKAKALAQAAAQRVQQAAAQARAQAAAVAQQAQVRAVQVAQQARQVVAQRAAQVTQAARSVAAPVVQRAQQAASTVKSWFGFRGLGEIGVIPVATVVGAVGIALTALSLAQGYIGQGEAVPTPEVTAIPETIPMADIEKYKSAASDCYNSAVAQGYVIDTTAKSQLLEKTCRERAAAQYASGAITPSAAETPSGVPGVDYPIQLPTGGGCFNASTGLPEPCRDKGVPTGYEPSGGYTPGVPSANGLIDEFETQPLPTDGRRTIIKPLPEFRPSVESGVEPGVFDEFETLVPGAQPVPGYQPGKPTKVSVPGVTPTYPGYEPGFAPTYAPEEGYPSEVECPDIPEMSDDEYCAQFPQCCEDVTEEGEIPIEEQATSVWDFEGIGI